MDHLRLILVVIGVSLIASIYLYEVVKRRRDARAREGAFNDANAPPAEAPHDDDVDDIELVQDRHAAANARGLVDLADYDIDEDFPPDEADVAAYAPPEFASAETDAAPPDGMIEVRARPRGAARTPPLGAVPDDAGLDVMRGIAARRDAPEQLDLSGLELSASGRHGGTSAASRAPVPSRAATATHEAPDDEEEMVIVLTVMARGAAHLDGERLREAFESNGLHHGEMDIFHRLAAGADDGALLFSAANVINPGTFDLARMADLETPGIALFLRLPGPERPGDAFQKMLDAANGMAERLDARVCDESRNPLSSQSVNHLRERIADFSRRRLLKA